MDRERVGSLTPPSGDAAGHPRTQDPPTDPVRRIAVGAVIGLVAAAVAIAAGHLVAGLVDPQAAPILTVGQSAIDATPEWLKSFAIRTFGERDKTVLLAGIGAALLVAAVGLGVASVRRPWIGLAGLAAFGLLGILAALARPVARPAHVLPPVAAVAAGAAALLAMRGAIATSRTSTGAPEAQAPWMLDRRRLLLTGAVGVTVAATAGGVGNLFARRFRADGSRAAVRIPPVVSRAGSVRDAQIDVPGLGPFLTPNERFYRVDTALLVPAVMAEDWRLRLHGSVEREITLDYERLLARPLIERDITLTCVSNPIGGRYVGNARWIGAPLRDLLEEAGPLPGADQIVSRSVDGFTIGTPTAVAMDGRDAMLAVAMNGEPLPLAHGFPVRMIVPGLYGYVSAMKWLVDIELTTFDAYDPYWVQRGWAERAPIKTMSRIDTPSPFLDLRAGEIPIAGVAWAQHVGIDRVEVSVDDDSWAAAELAGEDTVDTWRQWVYRWNATPGDHRLRVRATDRSGETQTADRAEPFPDGATGHHEIVVRVE
ncbi:MAG TPA: molybdopterin-dependent oxidoreductase [Actinomycetota bacterium]|nr:molybdopterin-dependent oxidoreductase [Actinomycetota bacterium]